MSSLTLKSTRKKLSDQYIRPIRPYAICETPSQLSSWLKESGLPPIKKSRKTGQEPIHNNQNPLVPRLIDFWQWTSSDLVSNATRGILAEFLVASALVLQMAYAPNGMPMTFYCHPDIKLRLSPQLTSNPGTSGNSQKYHFLSLKPAPGMKMTTSKKNTLAPG